MKFIMVVKLLRESKDSYKLNFCGWNNLMYYFDKNGVKIFLEKYNFCE